METRRFLVESDAKGLRAALVIGRKLEAIEMDRSAHPTLVGSVQSVRVARNLPGLGSIVKLADGRELLLDRDRNVATPQSGDSLKVQVTTAARGDKLGRASSSISLSGRSVIHLPLETGISASRRLALDAEKRAALDARLTDLPGSWILRRTAGSIVDSDFVAEIAALSAEGLRAQNPGHAIPAPDAFRRLVSDYGVPAPDSIVVAGRDAERSVRSWCAKLAPSLETRIERYGEVTSLFDLDGLGEAIEGLAGSRVALIGGGSLIIEHTEALTAIDVNSGTESNALSANLAAAEEIARQIQLRHIGGILVIDFISLARPRDRDRVVNALKSALASDPGRTHVLPMSAFGLVEMTRERRGPGLEFEI